MGLIEESVDLVRKYNKAGMTLKQIVNQLWLEGVYYRIAFMALLHEGMDERAVSTEFASHSEYSKFVDEVKPLTDEFKKSFSEGE